MNIPTWFLGVMTVWAFTAIIVNFGRIVGAVFNAIREDSMSREVIALEDDEPQLLVPKIRSQQVDPALARDRFVVAQNRQRLERGRIRNLSGRDPQK